MKLLLAFLAGVIVGMFCDKCKRQFEEGVDHICEHFDWDELEREIRDFATDKRLNFERYYRERKERKENPLDEG